MSRLSLVKNLQSKDAYSGLNEVYVKWIISVVFDIIAVKLHYKRKFRIKGFGSFMLRKYVADVDNVTYTVKFKPSKYLETKLN